MPTNIALRSPQFKQIQIPVSGVASAKCVINIDGINRYTLIKNTTKQHNSKF